MVIACFFRFHVGVICVYLWISICISADSSQTGRGGGISLISNKLKRLFLPSIIFSTAYYCLFCDITGWRDFVYSIINGCGHMWFLPMLFWCFIGGWILEQIQIRDTWKMLFLICLNLLCVLSLPLQLNSAIKFMAFFYGGYVVFKHIDEIKTNITPKRLLLGWIVFFILFAFLRSIRDYLVFTEENSSLYKCFMIVGDRACQLIYASIGLMMFYCSALFYVQRHQLIPFILKMSSFCFGVYLFQQFVLQILYYKTSFPILVGPYWLPWFGFVIAIIVSYLLSDFFLRTRLGKFLIG